MNHLSACRVLQQVTDLRLRFDTGSYQYVQRKKRSLTPVLELVAATMPQLVSLDISHNDLRSACGAEDCMMPTAHDY